MRARLSLLAAVSAALALPRVASAHDAIEILDIVLEDSAGVPLVLVSTYGLIARRSVGDPWRYVCPTLHGGPEAPASASAGPDRIWVVTVDGAQVVSGEIVPLTEKLPGLKAHQAPKLVATPDGVIALTEAKGGAALHRLEANELLPLFEADVLYQDIVPVSQGVMIASVDWDVDVTIARVAYDGSVTASVTAPATGFEVRLHRSKGDVVFASVPGEDGKTRVVRVDADTASIVYVSDEPIFGIFVQDGRTFLSIGRVMHELVAGAVAINGEETQVTRVVHGVRGPYAVSKMRLFDFGVGGRVGAVVFAPEELLPPDTSGLDADETAACELEWRDLEYELGLEMPTNTPPPPGMPAPGGCSATGAHHDRRAPVMLLVLGVMLRRLRNQEPSARFMV